MSHLASEYDDGYDDGYNDAFAVRTSEAMATIRTFWRKLSLARRQRDIILTLVSKKHPTMPSELQLILTLSEALAKSENELRIANHNIDTLREALTERRTHQWLISSPPHGYGTYTVPTLPGDYTTNDI